ncbi:MAG: MBL fold metallo-hydrolase [Tannerellaceae bacterium]
MKITILIDNTGDTNRKLACEHGLSIYFEKDGKKYLYDTGASHLFIENAKTLGIDISEIDALILSHLHDDHTGGLQAFLQVNDKAKIYLSDKAKNTRCYSFNSGAQREISIDFDCICNAPSRFYDISKTEVIALGITIVSCKKGHYPCPKGNAVMKQSDRKGDFLVEDSFSHELAVVLSNNDTQTILSACSHNGFLNIIDTVKQLNPMLPINTFIGGLHFPNTRPGQHLEQDSDFEQLASQLKNLAPGIRVITGHCTGSDAIASLSKHIKLETFHSGFSIY